MAKPTVETHVFFDGTKIIDIFVSQRSEKPNGDGVVIKDNFKTMKELKNSKLPRLVKASAIYEVQKQQLDC